MTNYDDLTPSQKKLWKEAQEDFMRKLEAEGNADNTDAQPKPLTIQEVRQMTPDQINEHWDEVASLLQEDYQ